MKTFQIRTLIKIFKTLKILKTFNFVLKQFDLRLRYDLEYPTNEYEGGDTYTVDAPLTRLPIFARAGSILVSQLPEMNLDDSRKNDIQMQIFMPNTPNSNATGFLFWDDGDSDLSYGQYAYVKFNFHRKPGSVIGWQLTNEVLANNYQPVPKVNRVAIYGLQHNIAMEASLFYGNQVVPALKVEAAYWNGAVVVENVNLHVSESFQFSFKPHKSPKHVNF